SAPAQTKARAGQRRKPNVMTMETIMLRHNSQRHGNCMKRSFGANFQNGAETGSSNTMHAIAHAARVFQSSALLFRSERAAHAAIKSTPISANASQEMRWLKASCSASVVWMKRKLSWGRAP